MLIGDYLQPILPISRKNSYIVIDPNCPVVSLTNMLRLDVFIEGGLGDRREQQFNHGAGSVPAARRHTASLSVMPPDEHRRRLLTRWQGHGFEPILMAGV